MKKIIISAIMLILMSISVFASVSWTVPSTATANTNFDIQIVTTAGDSGGYKILKPSTCTHVGYGTLGTDNYVRNNMGGSGTTSETFKCSSTATFSGEYTTGSGWLSFPSKTVTIGSGGGGTTTRDDFTITYNSKTDSQIDENTQTAITVTVKNPTGNVQDNKMYVECGIYSEDYLSNIGVGMQSVVVNQCFTQEQFVQAKQFSLSEGSQEQSTFTVNAPSVDSTTTMYWFCQTYEQCGDGENNYRITPQAITVKNTGTICVPGDHEICDSIDNTCDGAIDEGCTQYCTWTNPPCKAKGCGSGGYATASACQTALGGDGGGGTIATTCTADGAVRDKEFWEKVKTDGSCAVADWVFIFGGILGLLIAVKMFGKK